MSEEETNIWIQGSRIEIAGLKLFSGGQRLSVAGALDLEMQNDLFIELSDFDVARLIPVLESETIFAKND